jgi:hypothetical protein
MTQSILVGFTCFVVIFFGSAVGFTIGKFLPEEHRGAPTERVVQGAMRTMSLLSALVLGLLVASAKGKFDTNNVQVEQFAAQLMLLNGDLTNFGAGAADARTTLEQYTSAKIADVWRAPSATKDEPENPAPVLDRLQMEVLALAPQNDFQRAMARGAADVVAQLVREKWLLVAEQSARAPQPFLLALMAWLCVLFVLIGLFAPRNPITLGTVLVCAFSIGSAVALIEDLDQPYGGFIVVSPEPMQAALALMDAK